MVSRITNNLMLSRITNNHGFLHYEQPWFPALHTNMLSRITNNHCFPHYEQPWIPALHTTMGSPALQTTMGSPTHTTYGFPHYEQPWFPHHKQPWQPIHSYLYPLGRAPLFGGEVGGQEELRDSNHAVQRGPDLVRHVCQEHGLGFRGRLGRHLPIASP